jgi:hypothetical protein
VEEALRAAVSGMASCAVANRQDVAVLAIVRSDGVVAIARPADGNTGDGSVAQCMANRFAARRGVTHGASGIVTFSTHVSRRR